MKLVRLQRELDIDMESSNFKVSAPRRASKQQLNDEFTNERGNSTMDLVPQKSNSRPFARPRIKLVKQPSNRVDDMNCSAGENPTAPASSLGGDVGQQIPGCSFGNGSLPANFESMLSSIVKAAVSPGIDRLVEENKELKEKVKDLKETIKYIQRERDQEEAKRAQVTTEKRAAERRAAESGHEINALKRLLEKQEHHNKQLVMGMGNIANSVDSVVAACGLRVTYSINEGEKVCISYHSSVNFQITNFGTA
jgi:hypothetical protein